MLWSSLDKSDTIFKRECFEVVCQMCELSGGGGGGGAYGQFYKLIKTSCDFGIIFIASFSNFAAFGDCAAQ